MNKSTFLARVMGLYFIITSLYILINYKAMPAIINSIVSSEGTFFLVAIITLILGLLLVVTHNIWAKDWRVLITILAWLTLISGIFRLYFLNYITHFSMATAGHSGYNIGIAIGFLIIGVFLTYMGFYEKFSRKKML